MKEVGGEIMKKQTSPVYIVSGGTGASGEQIVHTVLVQFPGNEVAVITVAHVRYARQIEDVVAQAKASGGTIVHTLVDAFLRDELTRLAKRRRVAHIDLMGPLLERLERVIGQKPLGHPGLYRRLNQAYFERAAAIDFAMDHDDGLRPDGWPEAEIVLVGVSRVGKTPLSMYLAVQGWKVANVPLVPNVAPAAELFDIDARRVIGLTMEPDRLVFHREQRRRRLGAPGLDAYTDPAAIGEELDAARTLFERHDFSVIDVTDKPIEASASQVIDLIVQRFGEKGRG
jgi:regulator of PEP synthase PpsR (kinase-PPPase family)